MLTLGGRGASFENFDAKTGTEHLLITRDATLPLALAESRSYIVDSDTIPHGFATYVRFHDDGLEPDFSPDARVVRLPVDYSYLGEGDIVRVTPPTGIVRTLYRKNSGQNFILTTERCNNYCLMCSQPPKEADDSWLVDDILRWIPLIHRSTPELTLTGGEPTLLGEGFLKILAACKSWLPETAIHILSNGRTFQNLEFARSYADIRHPDVMVGIPLYSDVSNLHDYVVQSDGAFEETVRGILNLAQLRQRIEIRVVIHKQTYRRLPMLAEFIARNLRFVDKVALMGLEMTGFTRANLEDLWIDPVEYQSQLETAVQHLNAHGVRTSIYNHQLCLLSPELRHYARKTISDWKNEYMPECGDCSQRAACGGFFSSARLRYSDHIRPFA